MMDALTREELGAFISAGKPKSKPRVRVLDKEDIAQLVHWFGDAQSGSTRRF